MIKPGPGHLLVHQPVVRLYDRQQRISTRSKHTRCCSTAEVDVPERPFASRGCGWALSIAQTRVSKAGSTLGAWPFGVAYG